MALRDRSALTIPALVAASALCVATVEYRGHHTGDTFYRFLIWNLILAWVPFVFALGAYASARQGKGVAAAGLGVLWRPTCSAISFTCTNRVQHRSGTTR